jgi:RNA polymerase sigma-70 factor
MKGNEDRATRRLRLFGELLGECHRELLTFIYSLVQHHADAEDVYQQVAVVLWEKFDTFEVGTNFAAWATTVAHNTARDFIRARRRNAITFSDEVLEAIAASYRNGQYWKSCETSEALAECVKKLSAKERRLVDSCYSRGCDFAAIATEEHRTVGAIYQAICRIRKKLYACVQFKLARESY